MTELDTDTRAALDALSPLRHETGSWEVVLAAADQRPRAFRLMAIPAVVLAVAGAVAPWPSSGSRSGVLDRALAAVGHGPVVHVVLEGQWGGTLLDLRTNARRELRGRREIWYDRDRNILREVLSLGGQVSEDSVYRPQRKPADVVGAAAEYRTALESGSARVAGRGEVDGIPVYWIVVHSEQLPDVGDGRDHEWTQQVAVSTRTYQPVATRETKDGAQGPDTVHPAQRVLVLENVPAAEADFGRVQARGIERAVKISGGWTPVGIDEAAQLLGHPPVGPGRRFEELPLAGTAKTLYGVGPRDGPLDDVNGVQLYYGKLDENGSPDYAVTPFISIHEVPRLNAAFRSGGYVPPEGKAFLMPNSVFLRADGLFVFVNASSDELALSAAQALEPIR